MRNAISSVQDARIPFAVGLIGLALSVFSASSCVSTKRRGAGAFAEPEVTGNATHFDKFGEPYGGCGVPESVVGSKNFVALNVQDTPGDYTTFLPRPIADKSKVGAWNNGLNCGRWMRVTFEKDCVNGRNSGEQGREYCEGGSFQADENTGYSTEVIVADSCQDNNRWCRDDRFHVDLSIYALESFQKNGQRNAKLNKNNWRNPIVRWQYIDAPQYKGDIKIGMGIDAMQYYHPIIITNLRRGIHGVEYKRANGSWSWAKTNGDMGQQYVLEDPSDPVQIKVKDAYGEMINGGRIYQFESPCLKEKCTAAYTPVNYKAIGGSDQIAGGGGNGGNTEAPGTKGSSDVNIETVFEGGNDPQTPPTKPSPRPDQDSNQGTGSGGALKAEIKTQNSWNDGLCANIIVTNTGSQPVSSWTLVIDAQGATVDQAWNSEYSKTGNYYSIKSAQWSGQIAPNGNSSNAGFCIKGNTKVPKVISIK